jgi:DNA polymerase elongation subunit (family B)
VERDRSSFGHGWVPNQFVGLFDPGAMKIRGIEIHRSDAPFLVKRAEADVLRCLSQARTLAELREQIPQALEIVRTYRRYLHDGHATVEELAITKSLSKSRKPIVSRPCR